MSEQPVPSGSLYASQSRSLNSAARDIREATAGQSDSMGIAAAFCFLPLPGQVVAQCGAEEHGRSSAAQADCLGSELPSRRDRETTSGRQSAGAGRSRWEPAQMQTRPLGSVQREHAQDPESTGEVKCTQGETCASLSPSIARADCWRASCGATAAPASITSLSRTRGGSCVCHWLGRSGTT